MAKLRFNRTMWDRCPLLPLRQEQVEQRREVPCVAGSIPVSPVMSETCDHIVEVVNASCGPGTGRTEFIRQSQLEHTNLWRDYNERLFKCEFCPLCGEKLKTDEVSLETLVAIKEALEQEIAERA